MLENIRPDATLTFSVLHVYGDDSGVGTFDAEVCGYDDDTSTCQTISLTITNVDPTADIDVSGATDVNGKPTIFGQAGQPVTFNGDMTDPVHFEHVTSFLYAHPDRFRFRNVRKEPDEGSVNLSVDTEDDALLVGRILARMERPHWDYDYDEVMALYREVGP